MLLRHARGAMRLLLAAILLAIAGGGMLHAQSNFAFWMGGTLLRQENGIENWGTSVGATGKFNVTPVFLLRGQFNVDRIQMQNIELPDFTGTQTMSFVSLGMGPELEVGGKDFGILAHVTLHGTIRTVSRILEENGRERVWQLTRFSLGVLGGAGFEAYITDNLGFEAQAQYDIFNFDATPQDPHWHALRVSAGVQFYLGRNFER
jgi:Outer membrane protein beta-barrel domain